MKTQFSETYASPHLDPVNGRLGEFDWQTLDRLLGEEVPAAEGSPDFALLAETLNRIFAWLLKGRASSPYLDRTIGRRTIAMIWVIRPDLIEGTPSLAKLARQLGETRAGLSWHAADFTRAFDMVSRGQAHGRNGRHADRAKGQMDPPGTDSKWSPESQRR